MPVYDYRCSTCSAELIDRLEPVKRVEVDCPYCGGTARRRPSVNARMAKQWEHPVSRDKFSALLQSHGASSSYARSKSPGVHRRWVDRQVGNGEAHR
jgi:putative FmdB family regulatory protein